MSVVEAEAGIFYHFILIYKKGRTIVVPHNLCSRARDTVGRLAVHFRAVHDRLPRREHDDGARADHAARELARLDVINLLAEQARRAAAAHKAHRAEALVRVLHLVLGRERRAVARPCFGWGGGEKTGFGLGLKVAQDESSGALTHTTGPRTAP